MKVYRVGILGFGFIGQVHAYGYLNLPLFYDPVPLHARITHVVTGRSESAEKARATVGAEVAATDYRAVTENPEIDIVHICTPNHLHLEGLLSAMRHQKHIYCDKPLVATADEAETIQAALADYRGIAQMTFQNRFFPATLRAKQLIEAGALGQILGFRACYLHGGSANPNAPAKWKLTTAAGGGVIADLASHVLDLVDWLIGPFGSLTAATKIAYPDRPSADEPTQRVPVDAEDAVTLLARMQSGALGTIEATKIATGAEDELRLEIHGTRGALRFNEMDPHHLEFHDATVPDQPLGGLRGWNRIDTGQRYPAPAASFPSPKAAIGWLRGHVACLANFLQAVADGRPAEPGLEQGIRVQKLMDCVRRSATENRWIDIIS
ncbi:MAG: Gfo/Idh/MocA family oxidoreductase [Thermoguttaceae bacterium]